MNPLRLWHGWGMHPAVWSGLCTELAQQDIATQTPALPGYDQSETVAPYNLDALVDAMLPATNIPYVLCGWSLGALLALHAARRHPQRISRLILIGATPSFVQRADWPHGIPLAVVDEFIAAVAHDPAAALKRFMALSNQNDVHARSMARTLTQMLTANPLPTAETLIAGLTLLRDSDLRAGIADITQPVLLLHGARDPLMPVAAAQWLADALPQAQLDILPEAAHTPFLSDQQHCCASIASFYRA
ncbi:Carboxylesterase BioH (Biotin synthesis protein BioH) [Herminiimonas arsenicoxydans]|uniref:Carboxylesterase BioH (Biotin synthesis protein BioH) n=1 Tax=Herminiimonas arsenicoxydans TaxID=204773 RepID=A4G5P0_HERAR|nr:Carboxylesterase BioH (Biotin synthesis protein BioH) [Herminiimonas arsenicoxydans]